MYRCAKPDTHVHKPQHLLASTPNLTNHLFFLWQLQQVKPYTVYMKDNACRCRWAPPTQLPHSPPPSWQSIPISTWMVFNYVPRGYHGSSISSVWQCNSLCPAAMSAKLRQFTCSCSYIALGKSDLPSIRCIHLISGTHSLTPPTWAVTGVTKSKGELCLIFLSIQRIWQPKPNTLDWSLSLLLCYILIYNHCHSSYVGEWIWCTRMYQVPDIIQSRYAEKNLL